MSLLVGDMLEFPPLYASTQGKTGPILPAAPGGSQLDDIIFGSKTDETPISAAPANHVTGVLDESINSFLYGRIYLVPGVLDLGNLVSAQTRQFSIWNATFDDHVIESRSEADTAGLDLTEPNTLPYTLSPLEQTYYDVGISLDGPATLNASYSFVIDGVTYTLGVTGNRVVIWPFNPNWASPVNESLEWKTNVLKSRNAHQQRISIRTQARRRLDYQFQIARTDTQHFDNIMFGWQNRAFALPYWQYRRKLTAAINPGDIIVPVRTDFAGFIPDQTLALFKDPENYEVLEILSVTSDAITLKSPVSDDWFRGDSVYPCSVSRLEANVPITRQTSRVLTGSCSFLATPVLNDPYTPDLVAPDVYNGIEVYLKPPNWADGMDDTLDYPLDISDYDVGAIGYTVSDTVPSFQKDYTWLFKSQEEVEVFRGFLNRRKGQFKPVYLPTWTQDLTPIETIASGSSGMLVRDRDFFALVGENPSRANMLIRTYLYGDFLRPITSVGKTGPNMNIGFTTPLGVQLDPGDIKFVSYVDLRCLAADKTTITWITDQVATVQATFLLVPPA